ncbi:hypothetical protein [Streptomyces sp. JJ36]|uniref:hypothetical protein n=1 Tax=Streptomyces sp. JJ36 TaxID=2736645 RepID=UPI001F324DE8|nr:hypothetical protein [Streptomyces sp. JJ36]MCF6524450.1 hypothetical protein [Streptomyces sp. JJ36]
MDTLAFVESPVQFLNVLEWAYTSALHPATRRPPGTAGAAPGGGGSGGPGSEGSGAAGSMSAESGPGAPDSASSASSGLPASLPGRPGSHGTGTGTGPGHGTGTGSAGAPAVPPMTVVVLPPVDPMTRGQLRRVAELARDEGHTVQWAEARGGAAPLKTVGALARPLRRASRVVIGDPFSRYVQLLLTLTTAPEVVVVDDGTATMEFVQQLARGERLTRWHRSGSGGPGAALFAPVSRRARSRLTPSGSRRVEIFSSMPVEKAVAELGVTAGVNDFAWTRARFGPPRLTGGTDLVGTSLVETGVVDLDRYLQAVRSLARTHGATRYFAHRRESTEKLHRVTEETGMEIVRPDLPLELVARRGPIGRTILSFPSTVVHTLPLALAGTPVQVAVCDIDPAWLTDSASPRAQGFLSGVTTTAPAVTRLPHTR